MQCAGDGTAGRCLERAGEARRQHDDALRSQLDGDADRRVAGYRTVDQVPVADAHRRKCSGYRAASEHGLGRRAAGQPHRAAAEQVGRHHVQRNGRAFEHLVRQMLLDEAAQPARIDRKATVEQSQHTQPTDGEELAATQATPDRLELRDTARGRCPREVGSVDRAHRRAHQQIGFHAAGDERAQHSHLDRTEASATRQDPCRRFHAPARRCSIRGASCRAATGIRGAARVLQERAAHHAVRHHRTHRP